MSKKMDQLIIRLLKVELIKLTKAANKAKMIADEVAAIGTESIEIHKELLSIIEAKESGNEVVARLDKLLARYKKLKRLHKMDFIKLIDNQSDAEFLRDEVAMEISNREWRTANL